MATELACTLQPDDFVWLEVQESDVSKICELNDAFRATLIGGKVMLTQGIQALGEAGMCAAIETVRAFNTFTEGNDPHGEHDFGSFEIAGERCFWKIDYYDKTLRYGSEDSEDPEKTTRVLTVMLASEY